MPKERFALAASALDTLPIAVLIVSRTGKIDLRNRFSESLLPPGNTVAQVLEATCDESIHWSAELAAAAKRTEPMDFRNISLQAEGRRKVLVDVWLFAMASPAADRVLIVVEDVSRRASMERRRAATTHLGTDDHAVARTAHQLNNPLDGVMRYVGLAQRHVSGETAGYLQAAQKGLKRMAGVLRELLASSSPSVDGRAQSSLSKLIQEAINVMQPRADAWGVAIRCPLGTFPEVQADNRVFEVFCNVIANALDAMSDGGVLIIHARQRDGQCLVEFTDTGVGLGKADPEELFELFYTTKPDGQGTGLGLAICREILRRLGGEIRAASNPAGGAVFTIQLPSNSERST